MQPTVLRIFRLIKYLFYVKILKYIEKNYKTSLSNIGLIKGKYFLGVLKSKGQRIGILNIDELIGE